MHLPELSASKNLYGRPCLQVPELQLVPTASEMDFGQELPPFLFGDASLEHSGGTFLVEFTFVDFVGLRKSHNTMCLILVLWELLPI